MKKIYKLGLSLGATASIVAPLTTIACNEKVNNGPESPKTDITNVNNSPVAPSIPTEKAFEVNGKVFDVKDDGIYFTKKDYQGKLWSGDNKNGKEVTDEIALLNSTADLTMANSYPKHGVELGLNDSFYFLFDNDDQDGLTINDFEKEFFFTQDSIMTGGEAEEINKSWGNFYDKVSLDNEQGMIAYSNNQMLIPFKSGKSIKYLGGGGQDTSYAVSFDEQKANMYKKLTTDEQSKMDAYYKNSLNWFGYVWDEGTFTAEKVASNAMKITMNFDATKNIPYATLYNSSFIVKSSDKTFKAYPMYLEKRWWDTPEAMPVGTSEDWNAKFFARKI